jgi:hypothetical protein
MNRSAYILLAGLSLAVAIRVAEAALLRPLAPAPAHLAPAARAAAAPPPGGFSIGRPLDYYRAKWGDPDERKDPYSNFVFSAPKMKVTVWGEDRALSLTYALTDGTWDRERLTAALLANGTAWIQLEGNDDPTTGLTGKWLSAEGTEAHLITNLYITSAASLANSRQYRAEDEARKAALPRF